MTWQEALESEALYAHPHRSRYSQLCADDWPDTIERDQFRQIVISLASGDDVARLDSAYAEAGTGRARGDCCGG